jgi:hypothetical protein
MEQGSFKPLESDGGQRGLEDRFSLCRVPCVSEDQR